VTQHADIVAARDATVAAFGRLDCFVHNANDSGAAARTVEDVRDAHWQPAAMVGLRPIFYVARSVLPELRKTQGSLIVLTSPAGSTGPSPFRLFDRKGRPARTGQKPGARMGTAGRAGQRTVAVGGHAGMIAYLEREPHMRPHMVKRAALRRMGDPELDIGRALNFLIGPTSRFVSGQTLIVSGGAMML